MREEAAKLKEETNLISHQSAANQLRGDRLVSSFSFARLFSYFLKLSSNFPLTSLCSSLLYIYIYKKKKVAQ
ncbi:hypothetical protein NC651_014455 [Populus alba x Populus x berolinensis]|nr:hypothetical protein NC651_014455 [Populus alba x Populus x berolinensis]